MPMSDEWIYAGQVTTRMNTVSRHTLQGVVQVDNWNVYWNQINKEVRYVYEKNSFEEAFGAGTATSQEDAKRVVERKLKDGSKVY